MTDKLPKWLEKDGKRNFYAADDVEAAYANGWKDAEGVRGNGEPWNPEPIPEETPQSVHIEAVAKSNAKHQDKIDARVAKEQAGKSADKPKK